MRGDPMNFPALVDAAARNVRRPRAETERYVRAVIEAIRQGLRDDGEVSLKGFGVFRAEMTPERPARNFQTGEAIVAAPKRKVKFTPAAGIEEGRAHPFDWRRRREAGRDHAASLPSSIA
jgi:DNA-binding protein HU-beta